MTRIVKISAAAALASTLLGAALIAAAAAPAVTITSGPADGSVATSSDITFAFDAGSASTTLCSLVGQSDADSFYACGSPQQFTLPDGAYRFAVEAGNGGGTTTVSRSFTVASHQTVTLSSPSQSPTSDNPITVNVALSQPTSNFTQSDISVSNGTVSNFGGSGMAYSFSVTPTVVQSDPDPVHHTITVSVGANQFDSNQASNALQIYWDANASSSATTTSSGGGGGSSSTTPTITITGGPANGSTTTTADSSATTTDVTFTFEATNASSTLCSITGSGDPDSWFVCSSPQTYTLPVGTYRFGAEAADAGGHTASTSITFSIAQGTTAASGSGSGSGGGGGSSGGGGGGNGQIVGSGPTAPGAPTQGNGNGSIAGGPPQGHAVIPGESLATAQGTSGHAVIPTGTTPAVGPAVATSAPAPVVSQSSGGSALVASNAPSTATPGVPNTGSDTGMTASDTGAYNTASSGLAAAAAESGGGVPSWVWLVLAGIVLIGVGVWAIRQPVV